MQKNRFKFSLALSVIWLFIALHSNAQFEKDYTPQKSVGTLPLVVTSRISEDYKAQLPKALEGSTSAKENITRQDFLINSNSFIKDLFHSGKVLFGDPTTLYVRRVLDKVLEKDTELLSHLQLFTLKSSAVNAMSTDQGYIFVTTGLISQLETEAQLAYILAHEASHYELKHNINQYLETKRHQEKRYYSYDSYDKALTALSSYSKQHEFEADKAGMIRFLKTEYLPEALLSMFDVLEYSNIAFDERDFDYALFEHTHCPIPSAWKLDSIPEIKPVERNDAYSTHPALDKRREVMYEALSVDDLDPENGHSFLVSEKEFFYVRNICRFETIKSNLLNQDYCRAIYHTWLLKDEFPENQFLDFAMAKAFYGLSKQRTYVDNYVVNWYKEPTDEQIKATSESVFGKYEDIQGNERKVVFAFSEMPKLETNLLALQFMLDYEKKHGESHFSSLYKKDLIRDLLEDNLTFSISKYTQTYIPPDSTAQDNNVDSTLMDTTDFSKLSKMDMIRYNRKKRGQNNETVTDQHFKNYILADYADNKPFLDLINEVRIEIENERTAEEFRASLSPTDYAKLERWEKKYGQNFGIKGILTITPFYDYLETGYQPKSRDRQKKNHLVSEIKKLNYTALIRENSSLLNLQNTSFNPQEFNAQQINEFNEMAVLNEWVREKLKTSIYDMIPLSTEYCEDITQKYNTKHLYYSGMTTYLNGPEQFHYLFDLETGERLLYKNEYFAMQHDYNTFLNSQIYQILDKVSRAPKKTKPEFNP